MTWPCQSRILAEDVVKASLWSMQVKSVLGLASVAAAGPSGEEHWDTVSQEAKQEADTLLKYVPCKGLGFEPKPSSH